MRSTHSCASAQGWWSAQTWVRCRQHRNKRGIHDAEVTVTPEDDLTGGPAEDTVRFAVDGTGCDIDLKPRMPPLCASCSRPTSSTPARPAGTRPAPPCARWPVATPG